jgi:hypothetical protein
MSPYAANIYVEGCVFDTMRCDGMILMGILAYLKVPNI